MGGGGVRVDVKEEMVKILKQFIFFRGGVGGCRGGGGVGVGLGRKGQGGCDRRIEVFGKIHKKKSGGGGSGGVRWGGGGSG